LLKTDSFCWGSEKRHAPACAHVPAISALTRVLTRYGGHRFADKNMRQANMLWRAPVASKMPRGGLAGGKEAMRAATTDDPLTPGYVPSAHRFAIDVPP
jgi:hypothetical protein